MSPVEFLGSIQHRIRSMPSFLWRAEARLRGAECAPDVMFFGRPLLSLAPGSRMVLSSGVRICSALRSNRMGCFQPSVLRTLAPGAELQLGDGVGMSGTVVCAGKKIIIGEKTIIGSGAVLFDNDGHEPAADGSWPAEYVKSARPILIGRGVFIGARSIIMKGVQIGDGAVIGIGSVVTRNVPPNSIYFGNPAREIGVRAIPFSD